MEKDRLNDRPIERVFDRIPLWIFIFLLGAINFVSFDTWPNEENNFTMARHFLNPDWLPESFSLQQWPGTNFIYWFIAGVGLKFLNFGQLAFWTRLINYLLYAFPLSKIFKELKINPLAALILLQLFFFKQEYMAGEWIWKGFEGKTLAYLFIFWSLYFLLKSSYYKVSIFAALATYCHVLVGGWYFVGVGIFLLIYKMPFVKTFRIALLYTVIVLPFIIYLGNYILSGESVQSEPSANWIYVFYRNSHHLVPTMKDHFWQNDWPFVALMIFSLGLVIKRWFQDELQHKISLLIVSFNLILLVGLLMTYIDEEGTILKFYVLRMSSISLFLELILITLFLIDKIKINKKYVIPVALFQVAVLLTMTYFGLQKNLQDWKYSENEQAYDAFVSFVKANSKSSDKFCFINYKDKRENVRFVADAERDRLVSYKMVPEGDIAILEWYNRIQQREKVERDISAFEQLSKTYDLDFLVSKVPLESKNQLELVYENKIYFVYRLR